MSADFVNLPVNATKPITGLLALQGDILYEVLLVRDVPCELAKRVVHFSVTCPQSGLLRVGIRIHSSTPVGDASVQVADFILGRVDRFDCLFTAFLNESAAVAVRSHLHVFQLFTCVFVFLLTSRSCLLQRHSRSIIFTKFTLRPLDLISRRLPLPLTWMSYVMTR